MNTFALPSHCCPPTYLGNKTIIQWRDNDFRHQTTFEFQIGHTNLCPVLLLVQINFGMVKTILDTKHFGTEICTEKAFLVKFKIFWSSSKSFLEAREIKIKIKTKTKIKTKHQNQNHLFINLNFKKITFINDTFWLL